MHPPSSTLNAAIRAMRGESNLDAVRPALEKEDLARVIACASETNRIVRALAALRGRLPALLDPPTIADPALHDAVARMIGTPEGKYTLWTWARIASAGWGKTHTDEIIDAVGNKTCFASAAAALIGPCDASARLLRTSSEIAFAIRRWGEYSPNAPTAWISALSARVRDWMIDSVLSACEGASCIPWLPPDRAIQMRIDHDRLFEALAAFAEASPTARTLHADLLQHLVAHAHPKHLGALTRLACAMKSKDVWNRVQTLIDTCPSESHRVVVAAPWDSLESNVRSAILAHASDADICAAIAAAAQRYRDIRPITSPFATAFFGALDPKVWDALPSDEQRRWRDALWSEHACLAVQSLGLRPEFLAKANMDNNLVHAAQRHAHDAATLRDALLPVALRGLPITDAYTLIKTLQQPTAPSTFFVIASGCSNPNIIAPAHATRCTSDDIALAVALQRGVSTGESIDSRCMALRNVLRGRSWNDLALMMATFTPDIRTVLTLDTDAPLERLAHPDHWDTMRTTLARLASLTPEIALPTLVALNHAACWSDADAVNAIADALRDHGDVFLAIMDALGDERLRTALLPLPEDAAQADALRTLAHDNPPSAQRLAHALRSEDQRAALQALLTAPPHHADAIWQALTDNVRSDIVATVAPMPSDGDPIVSRDPMTALALAAVRSGDDDLLAAGIAALAARPERVRTIWDRLSQEALQALHDHLAFVDLPITHARPQKPPSSRRRRG